MADASLFVDDDDAEAYEKYRRDPMSAYIFITIMEYLTQCINEAVRSHSFKLHPKCKNPQVTSLMFADDVIIFCKPDAPTITTIMRVLKHFYDTTGLAVNFEKSAILMAGVDSVIQHEILAISGLSISSETNSYLGIPLATSRISTIQCLPLYAKITARMEGWSNSFLSQAGRLTLIKSIIFSMNVYWARTFILPYKLLKMIRTAMMRFFWTGKTVGRYLSPVSFKSLEKPVSKGGLGIQNLLVWNRAALVKHLDKYLNDSNSLWALWSRNYVVQGKDFWLMSPPQRCSWTWRSLFKLRNTVLPLIKLPITPDRPVNFWKEPWYDFGCILLSKVHHSEVSASGVGLSAKVKDILHYGHLQLPYNANQRINSLWTELRKIVFQRCLDFKIAWKFTTGIFSISRLYYELMHFGEISSNKWSKRIWKKDNNAKENMLLWKVLNKAVFTKDKLIDRGITTSVNCNFCDGAESIDHIFFQCSQISLMWKKCMLLVRRSDVQQDSASEWDRVDFHTAAMDDRARLCILILKKFVRHVWLERNTRQFNPDKASTMKQLEIKLLTDLKFAATHSSFLIDPGIFKAF